jgi:chaperonin GroES
MFASANALGAAIAAITYQSRSIPKGVPRMATKVATTTKLTPLHDRIVVSRIAESETSRGGIIIPDTAKDKPQEGEVIAVGKGKSNDEGKVFPLAVKAGDRILFGKYAGTEIKIDGEDFLIMREEEVLGILDK